MKGCIAWEMTGIEILIFINSLFIFLANFFIRLKASLDIFSSHSKPGSSASTIWKFSPVNSSGYVLQLNGLFEYIVHSFFSLLKKGHDKSFSFSSSEGPIFCLANTRSIVPWGVSINFKYGIILATTLFFAHITRSSKTSGIGPLSKQQFPHFRQLKLNF